MSSEGTTGQRETSQGAGTLLKLRVALKGRPVRSYTFQKEVVTVGRDPDADVFLDNPGISRNHVRLERRDGGYCAEDLGSANGTFLNDQQMESALLQQDDVLRVGKFSIWIAYETDRRETRPATATPPTPHQGTTVLTTDELDKMIANQRRFEAPPVEDAPAPGRVQARAPVAPAVWKAVLTALLAGAVLGSALTWWVAH